MNRVATYILCLTPLSFLVISHNTMFPYIVGKNLVFRVLVEFSFVFWLAGKPKINLTFVSFSVFLFTIINGFSVLFGVNQFHSMWSSFERMEGYITIIHLCMFFVMLRTFEKKDWTIFLNVFALISVVVGISAFRDFKGTIGNEAFLSGYLMLAIAVKLMLSVNSRLKPLYLVAVLFDLYLIWGAGIRGCLVGVTVGMLCFFLLIVKHKKIALASMVLAILLVSIGIYAGRDTKLVQESRMLSKLSNITTSTSSRFRLVVWDMMWKGVKERPLLGWGQENQEYVYNKHKTDEIIKMEAPADRAHNLIIDKLVTTGFVGLICYLFIWVAVMLKLFKLKTMTATIVICGLVAFFVQNLFVFETLPTYVGFYSLIAFTDSL